MRENMSFFALKALVVGILIFAFIVSVLLAADAVIPNITWEVTCGSKTIVIEDSIMNTVSVETRQRVLVPGGCVWEKIK